MAIDPRLNQFVNLADDYAFQHRTLMDNPVFNRFFETTKPKFKEACYNAFIAGITDEMILSKLLGEDYKQHKFAAKTLEHRTQAKVERFFKKHMEILKKAKKTFENGNPNTFDFTSLKEKLTALNHDYEAIRALEIHTEKGIVTHDSFRSLKKGSPEQPGLVKFLKANKDLIATPEQVQDLKALLQNRTEDHKKTMEKIDTMLKKIEKAKPKKP